MLALVAKKRHVKFELPYPNGFYVILLMKLGMCPSSNLVSMCNLFGHSEKVGPLVNMFLPNN